jgi:hypothetical protein
VQNPTSTGAATTPANTGGFITNSPIGTANNNGVGNTATSGYVPLLQTPTASFPSPLSTDLPVTPAGITNNPSALMYSNSPRGGTLDIPPAGGASDVSLGEVARQYRGQGQLQAGHVYTNADIANLDRQNQVGSSIGPQGNTTAAPANAQNQSPTTPAVNNAQQPDRNPSMPAGDSQAPPVPTPQR